MDEPTARRLIWIPIIHTPEDMGKLRASVRDYHVGRSGHAGWEAHVRAVAEFWRKARRRLEGLELGSSRLRLYQDALPLCGFEERIVREVAATGSANHQLLADLMARGAILTGTESPQLLVEEYEWSRQLLEGPPLGVDVEGRSKALLEARDQFMADQIARTLQVGETGLIFLGMAHSLEGRLPGDIRVERLDLTTRDRR